MGMWEDDAVKDGRKEGKEEGKGVNERKGQVTKG